MARTYVGNRLPPDYKPLGFAVALILHGGISICLWLIPSLFDSKVVDAEVYSVTLEGGRTIGGRFQVGSDAKKQPMTPPKNVASEAQKTEDRPLEKEPRDTVPPAKEIEPPEPDAIKTGPEKEEPIKSTPQPTKLPKSTPVPKPTALPKATSAPKPTSAPRATVATKNTSKRPRPQEENPDQDYKKAMQRYLGPSSEGGGTGYGAATLGGDGTGGGIQRPPEFFTYRTMLKNRVKSGWRWFDATSSYVATIEIQIEPSGRIASERIIKSSGNAEFDQSLLRAVRAADPLPAPPSTVYQYFRITQMVFDPKAY
jgi:colicin import membrane protein